MPVLRINIAIVRQAYSIVVNNEIHMFNLVYENEKTQSKAEK